MSAKSSFYNVYDIKNNEEHVLWAQCSFQNHHQTFHDRCPEKIGPLPKKSDHWFHSDMSRKYGTGPDLHTTAYIFHGYCSYLVHLMTWVGAWTQLVIGFLCSFLPEASFGLQVLSSLASVGLCVRVCVCINHELVRMITHRSFKLGSPNLDQRCKTPWFRSLLFLGMIDIDLQGQI